MSIKEKASIYERNIDLEDMTEYLTEREEIEKIEKEVEEELKSDVITLL